VSSTPEPTAPCKTPGWWGCRDETSSEPPITSPPALPTETPKPTVTSTGCQSREWFGLICVDPSPTTTSSGKGAATATGEPEHKWECQERSWLGYCREWVDLGGGEGAEGLVEEL
jgi:lipase ATG15